MIFGVAGVPTNYKGKFKDLFNWLRDLNLNAYEIQCVYGFKISEINQQIIKKEMENGFNFSIHAPYYINLGSLNEQVVENSINHLKKGVELAKSIGVNRIIFHPGGGHNNTPEGRKIAISNLINHINNLTNEIDMGDVKFYPEIGGKTNNLGSLDEIIEICKNCRFCYPCIDIAHLHAREIGSIVSIDVLREKLEKIKQNLPEKFKYIHFHAYTIEYNDKGEVKHLVHGENMKDGSVGRPNLEDFVKLLIEMDINPWVVSEARDSQELGAKYMRDLYNNYAKNWICYW